MFRFLFCLGVPAKHLILHALLCVCITFYFASVFPNDATADKTFNTDVYIAVPPVEGEPFFQLYYSPRDFVLIPKSEFGKDGTAKYSDKIEGAAAIKKKIENAISQANDKYKDCGVIFEVRNIYFIKADHDKLKNNYDAEAQQLSLGVDKKTGKSSLLSGFGQAAVASDAFNVLFTPLKEASEGEPGRGEEPGNTSVVSLSSALNELDRGQILIHEFGHNLGLEHKNYSKADAFKHGMSASLPDRRPGQPGVNTPSDPKLTKEECEKIKKRIGKGLYDKYMKPKKTAQAPPLGAPDGQQAALSVPVSNGDNFNGTAGSSDPIFEITGGGFTGQLNRHATGMLGTDNGVNISPNNLVFLNNDATADGYFVNFNVDTTGLDNVLWGDFFQIDPATSFSTGFSAVHIESNATQHIDRIPTGADNGLIFSPQGVNGGLGGGLNAGNRDFVNLNYMNWYESDQYRLSKQMAFNSGPIEIQPLGWMGFGQIDIKEIFSGEVDGINQNFIYHNMINVDTFSIGGGVNVEFPVGQIGGVPVEYYGGISVEAQFHDQSGHSTLVLDGGINAQETQNLGGSETTAALQVNAGFSFELNDSLELVIGAQYRNYETPGVSILPEQPARIEWRDASEYIIFAAVKAGFGKNAPDQGRVFRSDRRLKRDIVHLSTLDNGIKLYRFKYLWDDQVRVGVMAQDLASQKVFRDAVVLMPTGFYAVNYRKLGLKMASFEAWQDYGLAAVIESPAAGQAGTLAKHAWQ